MGKKKKTPLKVVYKSVWSEIMTDTERNEAQQRVDDTFNFLFEKTFENMQNEKDS